METAQVKEIKEISNEIKIYLIVASTKDGGIGRDGIIPWTNKSDMTFFRNKTTKTKDPNKMNAVIMGRKSYLSVPSNFRPLKGRYNVVLSRNEKFEFDGKKEQGMVSNDLIQSINILKEMKNIESIFIAGGGEIYEQALKSLYLKIDSVFLTIIDTKETCDTFVKKELYDKTFPYITELTAGENCQFLVLGKGKI